MSLELTLKASFMVSLLAESVGKFNRVDEGTYCSSVGDPDCVRDL